MLRKISNQHKRDFIEVPRKIYLKDWFIQFELSEIKDNNHKDNSITKSPTQKSQHQEKHYIKAYRLMGLSFVLRRARMAYKFKANMGNRSTVIDGNKD